MRLFALLLLFVSTTLVVSCDNSTDEHASFDDADAGKSNVEASRNNEPDDAGTQSDAVTGERRPEDPRTVVVSSSAENAEGGAPTFEDPRVGNTSSTSSKGPASTDADRIASGERNSSRTPAPTNGSKWRRLAHVASLFMRSQEHRRVDDSKTLDLTQEKFAAAVDPTQEDIFSADSAPDDGAVIERRQKRWLGRDKRDTEDAHNIADDTTIVDRATTTATASSPTSDDPESAEKRGAKWPEYAIYMQSNDRFVDCLLKTKNNTTEKDGSFSVTRAKMNDEQMKCFAHDQILRPFVILNHMYKVLHAANETRRIEHFCNGSDHELGYVQYLIAKGSQAAVNPDNEFCAIWTKNLLPAYCAMRSKCTPLFADQTLSTYIALQQLATNHSQQFTCESEDGRESMNTSISKFVYRVVFNFTDENETFVINPPSCPQEDENTDCADDENQSSNCQRFKREAAFHDDDVPNLLSSVQSAPIIPHVGSLVDDHHDGSY